MNDVKPPGSGLSLPGSRSASSGTTSCSVRPSSTSVMAMVGRSGTCHFSCESPRDIEHPLGFATGRCTQDTGPGTGLIRIGCLGTGLPPSSSPAISGCSSSARCYLKVVRRKIFRHAFAVREIMENGWSLSRFLKVSSRAGTAGSSSNYLDILWWSAHRVLSNERSTIAEDIVVPVCKIIKLARTDSITTRM